MANPREFSIALFHNLPAASRGPGYRVTTRQDVMKFMDLDSNPSPIPVSDFVHYYWKTVSHGVIDIGLDILRDENGDPFIPEFDPTNGVNDWRQVIFDFMDLYADEIWRTSGQRRNSNGDRIITSLVLVQNANVVGQAYKESFDRTVNGQDYKLLGIQRIKMELGVYDPSNIPGSQNWGRKFWDTIIHEYAHNFLQFGDLYKSQGATGYWDALGDDLNPGRMPEIGSHFKAEKKWIAYKHNLSGPFLEKKGYSLLPYTTSGEAIKIIPDPDNNPHEFFTLEYRKKTGDELWRPDGGLTERGLLITHYNTRLGLSNVSMMHEAPFFDPEFADYSDYGHADFTSSKKMKGVLFPYHNINQFDRHSWPSSDFYGEQPSGLKISNIRFLGDGMKVDIEIQRLGFKVWQASDNAKGISGRFYGPQEPDNVMIFQPRLAALLRVKDSQWFVSHRCKHYLGDWELQREDRLPLVGDFDGNGQDELYLRKDHQCGIAHFTLADWLTHPIEQNQVGEWKLEPDDWELVADIDGDGKDEIVIRSADSVGVMKLTGSPGSERLELLYKKDRKVNRWTLSGNDKMLAGRFRALKKEDVIFLEFRSLAILTWRGPNQDFVVQKIHHTTIGTWSLEATDEYVVGDFDGDGYDEIFVMKQEFSFATLIKWDRSAREFDSIWIEQGLGYLDENVTERVHFDPQDRIYTGRFHQEKDAVLLRKDEHLFIIGWEGDAMKVRMKKGFSNTYLKSGNQFILGDYHRVEQDINVVEVPDDGSTPIKNRANMIGDNITDIFVLSDSGTAVIGVNYRPTTEINAKKHVENMGITWKQDGFLLAGY